jgi:polyphosphate glucokinase
MQAIGLGSCLIVDGVVEPMELGHLPYRKRTYEHYVGRRGLEKFGKKKWRRYVADVVAWFTEALEPATGLPGGQNANAFVGGFRLWEDQPRAHLPSCREWSVS